MVVVWSSLLDALRRRRRAPEASLAEIGVAKGMNVADIGAGYGYFAFPAGEVVGDEGTVYAVEPNPRRAQQILRKADERGARNVRVLQAGAEELGSIPSGSVDIAISMSSFHHFADASKALRELRRIVRQGGGRVYIRDMKAGRLFRHGSDAEQFMRVVLKEFPDAQFEEGSGYIVARVRI